MSNSQKTTELINVKSKKVDNPKRIGASKNRATCLNSIVRTLDLFVTMIKNALRLTLMVADIQG